MQHQIDDLEARRREIIDALRERIIASGIARTRLALEAGLSEMTLRSFDLPGWNPAPETIRKVDAFLSNVENRITIRNNPSECKGPIAERPGEAAA